MDARRYRLDGDWGLGGSVLFRNLFGAFRFLVTESYEAQV